jgi:competence CoiA-like predicted nuclease
MLFALSRQGKRIKANKCTDGFCEMCGELLTPRCGSINIHHWAHKSGKDCDSWWESETDWHRNWKNLVDEEFRERVIEKEGVNHRADIRLLSGIIIELQNSPLSFEERGEREQFYGNMIWIIHLPKAKIEIIQYC